MGLRAHPYLRVKLLLGVPLALSAAKLCAHSLLDQASTRACADPSMPWYVFACEEAATYSLDLITATRDMFVLQHRPWAPAGITCSVTHTVRHRSSPIIAITAGDMAHSCSPNA